MKKIILATLISGAMSASALAADAGSGTVTFTGSIIEAACSIAPDSVDQTVELGAVASSQLAENGKSTPRTFQIELQNCDMSFETGTDAEGDPILVKTVSASFTGGISAGDTDQTQLAIIGTASGAGVVIMGPNGEPVKLDGTPSSTPALNLQNGQNILQYAAYLQGNGTVVPGDFTALATYSLNYE